MVNTCLSTPEDRLREDAQREYEQCRLGIEKYDEHMFRIRQWSIALTAVVLAAVLGLSQTEGMKNFKPPLALFVFTLISFAFWMLDSLNKSLQTVHIHNSRDIEKFLRGTRDSYVGPTISLRFQRKEKRHWTSTVKNLTDQTVMMFHLLPILIFWAAIIVKFWDRLCFGGSTCEWPRQSRYLPLAPVVVITWLLYCSWIWRNGRRTSSWMCPLSKYFFRPRAAARSAIYARIFKILNKAVPCGCTLERKPCSCGAKRPAYSEAIFPPFRADFHDRKSGTLLFIDRYKIYRDSIYLEERRRSLEPLGFKVLHIDWQEVSLIPGIFSKKERARYFFKKARPSLQISDGSTEGWLNTRFAKLIRAAISEGNRRAPLDVG